MKLDLIKKSSSRILLAMPNWIWLKTFQITLIITWRISSQRGEKEEGIFFHLPFIIFVDWRIVHHLEREKVITKSGHPHFLSHSRLFFILSHFSQENIFWPDKNILFLVTFESWALAWGGTKRLLSSSLGTLFSLALN